MSMTQTIIGVLALGGLGSLAVDWALPDPPRIAIHRISYSGGEITQDRTVNSDKEVFQMHWTAELRDAATDNTVPWCFGSGDFAYKAGRAAKTMALAVWVGNSACTPDSLPAGRYVPLAVYSWGDNQVIGRGEAFEVAR